MSHTSIPDYIDVPKYGQSPLGSLSVAQKFDLHQDYLTNRGKIPFDIKRVYWITDAGDITHRHIVRGGHAHRTTEQVFFCLKGKVKFLSTKGNIMLQQDISGKAPEIGLYMPPYWWHDMEYKAGSICLALASSEYDEQDYMRDYDEFQREISAITAAGRDHTSGNFSDFFRKEGKFS